MLTHPGYLDWRHIFFHWVESVDLPVLISCNIEVVLQEPFEIDMCTRLTKLTAVFRRRCVPWFCRHCEKSGTRLSQDKGVWVQDCGAL